jgi:hypothetical protein
LKKERRFIKISMSRKIVFINQATGYLTIDVINEFAKKFNEIGIGQIKGFNIIAIHKASSGFAKSI